MDVFQSYEQQFSTITADITARISKIPNLVGSEYCHVMRSSDYKQRWAVQSDNGNVLLATNFSFTQSRLANIASSYVFSTYRYICHGRLETFQKANFDKEILVRWPFELASVAIYGFVPSPGLSIVFHVKLCTPLSMALLSSIVVELEGIWLAVLTWFKMHGYKSTRICEAFNCSLFCSMSFTAVLLKYCCNQV